MVFGEENSTMMLRPVAGSWPNDASPATAENTSFQYSGERLIFRNPFTQLNEATSGTFATR